MAKKTKPAKKAALKKAAVKKSTPKKQVKKTVKKAASKKPAAKKPVKKNLKKAAPKRSSAKKPVKKAVKKAASKKPVSKKPVKKIVKKAVPKRSSAKKPVKKSVKKIAHAKTVQRTIQVIKKTSPKKIIPVNVAAKPVSPAGNKQVAPVQLTIPEFIPVASTLPAIPAVFSPDDVVGKAANIETNRQMMVPGDGLNAAPVAENPVTLFDRNVFNKATAKGDPHSGMQISSVPKGAKKPSAKKPLWRK